MERRDETAVGVARDADAKAGEHWARDWGQLLRLARQVAGLSLTELSGRTGLSKGYLSKLESGHASARNPSRATLAALSRELPSFRPLAHTLEPNAPTPVAALADAAPPPPLALFAAEVPEAVPIQLGWRELELLIALLTLEQSALPLPLTAIALARAVGRTTAAVAPTLANLVGQDLLRAVPPTRVGAPPSYALTARAASQIGLERLGDALVLASALLTQAPLLRRAQRS
jgi:transcriptional regulator with XRE-family HTH domain